MWARRLTAMGVVVFVAAGCSAGSDGSDGDPVPRPPAAGSVPAAADPAAAVAAAKARLGREPARFAQDAASTLMDFTGVVNAETKNWEITGKEYVVRRVGTEIYVRASGKTAKSMLVVSPGAADRVAAGGWLRTRLPHGRELSVVFNDNFPWNLADPAARATGLTRTGDRSFTGALPAGESRPDMRVSIDLDDQGRFTSIRVDSAAQKMQFTFSDFGTNADITAPPPGEVTDEENPSFLSSLALF